MYNNNNNLKLPKSTELVDLVNSILTKPCKYFIAGGSVVGIEYFDNYVVNDIDIYFESQEDLEIFKDSLIVKKVTTLESLPGYEAFNIKNSINKICNQGYLLDVVKINSRAILNYTNIPVQLITMKFGTPDQILETFDLNKVQIGITNDKILIEKDRSGYLKVNSIVNSSIQWYIKYSDLYKSFNINEFRKIVQYYNEEETGDANYKKYDKISQLQAAFNYITGFDNNYLDDVCNDIFEVLMKIPQTTIFISQFLGGIDFRLIPLSTLKKYPIVIAMHYKNTRNKYGFAKNYPELFEIALQFAPEYII